MAMLRWDDGAIWLGAAALLAICPSLAAAQQDALRPIPAAECQQLATKVQAAAGLATSVSEDDFTDLFTKAEGRSCHIMATASGLDAASASDVAAKIGTVFTGWNNEPDRADDGAEEAENGYIQGTRIATVDVSWEPGPGASCSQQLPLSACKITPQQRLWTAIIDVVEKTGK
jgi:hypothetical protein